MYKSQSQSNASSCHYDFTKYNIPTISNSTDNIPYNGNVYYSSGLGENTDIECEHMYIENCDYCPKCGKNIMDCD